MTTSCACCARILITASAPFTAGRNPPSQIMFLKVQGDLSVTQTWGNELPGGSTLRFSELASETSAADIRAENL